MIAYTHERVDHDSTALGRRTFYNLWLPPEPRGQPVLLYLHGWGGEPRHDTLIQAITALASAGHLAPIVVMPWGFDAQEESGWMDRWDGSLQLHTHLMRELLPEVRRSTGADLQDGGVMVCGDSMGGYGALNLALNYQDVFSACVAWSPADTKLSMGPVTDQASYPAEMLESTPELAGVSPREMELRIYGPLPESIEHRERYSPWHCLDRMEELKVGLWIDCGDRGYPEIGMRRSILELRDKLESRGMAYVLEQYHGEHCSNHTLPSLSARLLFLYDQYLRRRGRELHLPVGAPQLTDRGPTSA